MSSNPDYLAARQEWLERYGSYIAQARNWRIAALSAIGIAALFGAGMVYEADRVHIVPYVVEVDKLGKAVELAQAVRAGSFAQPVVQHIVSRFTWLAFTRSPDKHVQKHFIDESYHYIASSAESSLDAFRQLDDAGVQRRANQHGPTGKAAAGKAIDGPVRAADHGKGVVHCP